MSTINYFSLYLSYLRAFLGLDLTFPVFTFPLHLLLMQTLDEEIPQAPVPCGFHSPAQSCWEASRKRRSKVPRGMRHPLLSNLLHIMKPKEDDDVWMMHWSNEEAASCWFSSAPPWSEVLSSQEAVHLPEQYMLQLQLNTQRDYRAASVLRFHRQPISSLL